MSDRVADVYDEVSEFEALLADAEANAVTDWEMEFVSDINDKFEKYGDKMYISTEQIETLERISKQ